MPFRFPLEAVLHLRQSLEHQQELRLRAAHQQVARVRHLISQIEAHARQMQVQHAQTLIAGTTSAEMQFALQCERRLGEHRQILHQELARLEKLRDAQQHAYQQARRERETFESLRDRQRHEYERETLRREQRELDDLFLLRRAYLRRRTERQSG